jgi:hypothetical protein
MLLCNAPNLYKHELYEVRIRTKSVQLHDGSMGHVYRLMTHVTHLDMVTHLTHEAMTHYPLTHCLLFWEVVTEVSQARL